MIRCGKLIGWMCAPLPVLNEQLARIVLIWPPAVSNFNLACVGSVKCRAMFGVLTTFRTLYSYGGGRTDGSDSGASAARNRSQLGGPRLNRGWLVLTYV